VVEDEIAEPAPVMTIEQTQPDAELVESNGSKPAGSIAPPIRRGSVPPPVNGAPAHAEPPEEPTAGH